MTLAWLLNHYTSQLLIKGEVEMEKNVVDINTDKIVALDFPPLPKEKSHIICYIDFLGSKEILSQGGQLVFFENIHDSFAFAMKFESKLEIFSGLKFKTFSDNILIAYEIEDVDDKDKVFYAYMKILNFLRTFAPRFIKQGILFRGGITIGNLALNDIMVWGNGLVDAVNIEENISIYPRIVISDKLLDIFNLYKLDNYEFEEKFSCLSDLDGCWFVDYIEYREPSTSEDTIKEGYFAILEKIKTEKRKRILQKYIWHKNYLLRAKEIHNEIWNDLFYINLDE